MSSSVGIEYLYEEWGLQPDVFDPIEARKESKLDEVVLLPTWWNTVFGSVNQTSPQVIVGVRGAGKSTIRRLITERVKKEMYKDHLSGLVLSIEIDHDVQGWASQPDDLDVTLNRFATLVIELITHHIVKENNKEVLKEKLSKREIHQIDRYLKCAAISGLAPEGISELRKKTKPAYKKIFEKFSIIKGITGQPHQNIHP